MNIKDVADVNRLPAETIWYYEDIRLIMPSRAETINGLYKTEVIHLRGPWRSFEAVEMATLEWIDRFNNCRLLEPIGNIPPAEAEAHYYA